MTKHPNDQNITTTKNNTKNNVNNQTTTQPDPATIIPRGHSKTSNKKNKPTTQPTEAGSNRTGPEAGIVTGHRSLTQLRYAHGPEGPDTHFDVIEYHAWWHLSTKEYARNALRHAS